MIFAQATECNPTRDAYGGAAESLLDCALPYTGLEWYWVLAIALLGAYLLYLGLKMRKRSHEAV